MIKQLKISACALAVCIVTANSAFAADSVDVKVIGTITPAACTPTLSGGGTIDYGTMNPSILSATANTTLAEKTLDFSITCSAPAPVAISVASGRLNTLGASTEATNGVGGSPADVTMFGTTNVGVMGLGLASNGAKIGGFGMRIQTDSAMAGTTAGGTSVVDTITSGDNGLNWGKATFGIPSATTPRIMSWAATGTTTPFAFETMTGKLGVQAYVVKSGDLDITKPVTFDGLSTITLVYL